MGATETVARWIVDVPSEDIPSEAIRVARESCVDCIGVMLAGAAQPVGQMIQDYVDYLGGRPQATVLVSGLRTSLPNAALANATMGHAMDYDDFDGFGHPTVAILPSLLALGEQMGVSGRQVLEAFVVGCEVALALSRATKYYAKQLEKGFHSTSVIGRLASTAACSRLMKLDHRKTVMALGISGSMAGGLIHNFGSMTKPLHAGITNRDGVTATHLASMGFTGGDQILEHPMGFVHAISGPGFYDLDAMADGLGEEFFTQSSLNIKRYPTCGRNLDIVDCILGLMQDHGFRFEDVAEAEVDQAPDSVVMLFTRPKDELQAKFSALYNVAAALVDGKVDIETFTPEKVNSPVIQEAMNKVRINVLPKWVRDHTAEGHPVTIRLKDGRVLKRTIERAQRVGMQSNPWGFENILGKFRVNASQSLPQDKVDVAVGTWSAMEDIEDIGQAVKTLVA